MFLYEFFEWLGATHLGQYLNTSTAAFASAEALHIVALSLVVGAALVTQLSALGITIRAVPAAEVARNLRPLISIGLVLVIVSGVLLVAAGPFKYYTNPLFPLKLVLLVAALITQWGLNRTLRRRASPAATRLLAVISLLLWTSVVIAGRWLGLI